MRSAEQILDLYKDRKAYYATLHGKMNEIAEIYNGKAKVPLPDFDDDRYDKPAIPNLLQQGVDQMAGRITSTTPMVTFSSSRPGVRMYDRRAQAAADTLMGWWQMDHLSTKQKIRGRRLIAYAMAPTVLRWDFEDHRPVWEVRHPIETYPSPDLQPGKVKPSDVIFSYRKSVGWLADNGYGEQMWRLLGPNANTVSRDALITIIEYMDKDVTVLMAAGYYPASTYEQYADAYTIDGMGGVVLEAFENPIGTLAVTIPTRITLDSMTGQFDNMVGMYHQQARLMTLETIAVEKGIFPDVYLVSRQGELGKIIDGPYDGRTGQITVIQGGDIKMEQAQPGYLTNPTIDRMERAQRVTSGIPAEFGGESTSNIRTGRRGDSVLSATVDFPVAEAQEIFAHTLEEENEIAIKMAKRFDGDTKRTIYVGTGNARRPVSYKPTETFEQDDHVVSFPATGADVNSLIIGIGQRVGLGIMSKKTAATLDPYIDNPESEHDQIIAEGLEQALVAGLQQQATQGTLPPLTLSKVMTLVANDKMELAEALNKVTEDALKEQQAQQGQMGPPTTPDAAGAQAAVGAIAGQPAIAGPDQSMPSMQNLSQMLGSLRRPAMTIQPMRGVQQGAV